MCGKKFTMKKGQPTMQTSQTFHRLGHTPPPSDTPTPLLPHNDLIHKAYQQAKLRHYLDDLDTGQDLRRFWRGLFRSAF